MYSKPPEDPPLKAICPHLTAHELAQAEENLIRYLEIAWRIFERANTPETVGDLTPDVSARDN